MALHLSIGPLNNRIGWSRYRDVNQVPTSLLADDTATIYLSIRILRVHSEQIAIAHICCGR